MKSTFNLLFLPSHVLKFITVILQSCVETVSTTCRKRTLQKVSWRDVVTQMVNSFGFLRIICFYALSSTWICEMVFAPRFLNLSKVPKSIKTGFACSI